MWVKKAGVRFFGAQAPLRAPRERKGERKARGGGVKIRPRPLTSANPLTTIAKPAHLISDAKYGPKCYLGPCGPLRICPLRSCPLRIGPLRIGPLRI